MNNIAILILAAGASSRMQGRDKLLEIIADQSLLRRTVIRAVATGAPVSVTIPSLDHPRARELADLNVRSITVENATSGMSASIQSGVAHLHPTTDGVMIVLADMPDLTTQDMRNLISAFKTAKGANIIRASDGGVMGHPIIFPARLFPSFANLSGDTGARTLLANEEVIGVPLPKGHATCDLDIPAQWTAWRTQNPNS